MDFRKILQKLRLSSTTSNNQTQTKQQDTVTNNAMANKAIAFYSHRTLFISAKCVINAFIVESTNTMRKR